MAATQLLRQDYDLVPLAQLHPHPENPRRGDVDQIAESIGANGFYGAVVAQRSTGHILAGNHRYLAARRRGLAQLPVVWVDVDDDRARRILLADNRTGDLAAYSNDGLLALLEGLALTPEALAGTGYDPAALDDLRASAGDLVVLPPQPTDATYAETPEEEAARAATRGVTPSIHEAGLRELILVYRAADHAEALALLGKLRDAAGDCTTADAVLGALRLAAADLGAFTGCLTSPTA